MFKIDWQEYKLYKKQTAGQKDLDNFKLLLEFLRSFYNKTSPFEVFDILEADSLSEMMLEKRGIKKPEDLEKYMYKKLSR